MVKRLYETEARCKGTIEFIGRLVGAFVGLSGCDCE